MFIVCCKFCNIPSYSFLHTFIINCDQLAPSPDDYLTQFAPQKSFPPLILPPALPTPPPTNFDFKPQLIAHCLQFYILASIWPAHLRCDSLTSKSVLYPWSLNFLAATQLV